MPYHHNRDQPVDDAPTNTADPRSRPHPRQQSTPEQPRQPSQFQDEGPSNPSPPIADDAVHTHEVGGYTITLVTSSMPRQGTSTGGAHINPEDDEFVSGHKLTGIENSSESSRYLPMDEEGSRSVSPDAESIRDGEHRQNLPIPTEKGRPSDESVAVDTGTINSHAVDTDRRRPSVLHNTINRLATHCSALGGLVVERSRSMMSSSRRPTILQERRVNPVPDSVACLIPGVEVARKFVILDGASINRTSWIRLAKNKYSHDRVVLKFYASRETFDNALSGYIKTDSRYIAKCKFFFCRLDGRWHSQVHGFHLGGRTSPLYSTRTWANYTRAMVTARSATFPQKNAALARILFLSTLIVGLVHGDIKPSTIMLFPRDTWKLVDMDSAGKINSKISNDFSVEYAAPEAVAKSFWRTPRRRPAQDMWSFGILAAEVFSNGRSYYGNRGGDEILSVLRSSTDINLHQDLLLGEDQQRFMSRLLVRDPDRRMTSTRALYRSALRNEDDITVRFTQPSQGGHESVRQTENISLREDEKEIILRRTQIRIGMEKFAANDSDQHFSQRAVQPMVGVRENQIDAVYKLDTEFDYRIRVAIGCLNCDRLPFGCVDNVRIRFSDGLQKETQWKSIQQAENLVRVFVLLDSESVTMAGTEEIFSAGLDIWVRSSTGQTVMLENTISWRI